MTSGEVPRDAEFFQDHFPGFPVLPGVMALDILKKEVERCLEPPQNWVLASVRNVKFSSYLKPGDTWECEVKQVPAGEAGKSEWSGRLLHQGRTAVSAKLIFEIKK